MTKTVTIGDIRTLTDDELNTVSGGMKAEVFTCGMKMTVESDGSYYGVVVRPAFEHTCVGFGDDGC
jgi:bacteriocin-like protein